MPEDALVLIFERNQFYKKKYHMVLGVYFLSIIVIISLSCMLYFLIQNPTKPVYFVADNVGRLIKEVPLSQPNMSTEQVSEWAVAAIEAAYSYNYVNYRSQLQNAQKYFTAYGWFKYMEGLNTSNNLVALNQRKMIFQAKIVDKPKLIREGLLSGAYAYKFEVPVLMTFLAPPYDEKSSFQNPNMVTITLKRVPLLESYKGLGVLQLNAVQINTN